MNARRVLITTAWLSPGDPVDRLLVGAGCTVDHSTFRDRARSGPQLVDLVGAYDAVIAGMDPFTADVIDAATGVQVIARTGVGYDNIDLEAATARGIPVCNTPGINAQSVAEFAVAMMLSIARGIPANVQGVRVGDWDQTSGRELGGSTLGLVGLGSIGKLVARIALAIGMRVIAHDVHVDQAFADRYGVEYVDLPRLLAESDFVSLHAVLDDTTRHLIDHRALASMKRSAFLINTSRGGVVDEDALASAIEHGQIAGAAIDVVEREPLPAGSRLRGLDNVIITAHIAAGTVQSRDRSGMMAAQDVIDALDGRAPSHVVNPEYADVRAASRAPVAGGADGVQE